MGLFKLRSETLLFFMEYHFYLKGQVTDKLWLITLGCLADVFLKMKEMNLLFQGKQLFVTYVKFERSSAS